MVQAGHIWWKALNAHYEEVGFCSSKADPCICVKVGEPLDTGYSLTTTHTVNVLGAHLSEEEADKVLKDFAAKWDLTSMKQLNLLLGLTIERLEGGDIGLTQSLYFKKVLWYFNLWDLHPLSTLLPPNCQVSAHVDPMTNDKITFMNGKPYKPVLGCVVWGSSGTRPDIAFACSALGHVQSNPAPEHWTLLVGLCCYIRGTLDYSVLYQKPTNNADGNDLKPLGYVNADWAGCVDMCQSTSGYIFMMAGAPVLWSAKCQPIVALSSTESEYVSMARGSQQAMWMNSWLDEAGLLEDFPFPLVGDNLGSISLTETNKAHGLSKHLHTYPIPLHPRQSLRWRNCCHRCLFEEQPCRHSYKGVTPFGS